NMLTKYQRLGRYLLLFAIFGLCKAEMANANRLSPHLMEQQIAIRGVVQSSEDNQPIEGVSVISDGKALAATDGQGRFEVSVATGTALTFSIMGYASQTVTATKSESNLIISLQPTSTGISEVVVTALGIKREEKSL